MNKQPSDIFGMSDKEFMEQGPDSINEESLGIVPEVTEPEIEEEEVEETDVTPEDEEEAGSDDEDSSEESDGDDDEEDDTEEEEAAAVAETPASEKKEEGEKPDTEVKAADSAIDYEAFYKEIMAPFKANNRMVELRSPEEAKQLMKMGAGFTKKMQAIAPYRKHLLMLENNGLLDEDKLSFLIDLDKRDPTAIQKLLKDSNIDPLDIDTTSEVTYREGNHRVTDAEATFISTMEDLQSNPGGNETLRIINSTWDQASKEVLWDSPELMHTIHAQKQNGIYDAITAEMDRLSTLGQIPTNTPFLQAYKVVGDQLQANGRFNSEPAPVVVGRSINKPKAVVKNGDKASAASISRGTPVKGKAIVNPLAESDEDFLKQFEGRL